MLRYNDQEVYDISTMATPAGIAHLSQPIVSARLVAMQSESLKWSAFNGRLRADGSGGLVLKTLLSVPATVIINVSCGR